MGQLHVLADQQSSLVDVVNRPIRRDMGQDNFGQQVLWTTFDGATPSRNGSTAGAGLYTQVIRSTASGGRHRATLLSATAKDATPSTSNAVELVQDAGLFIGAGKSLRLYATAGANNADLSADTAGNLVVGGTTGGLTLNGNVRWKSGTAFVMELDHSLASTDRVITVPDATDTLALLARTQTFSGTNTFSAGVLLANGTTSIPSWGFTSDPNTGVRWLSADRMWFVAGGSDVMQVANTGAVLGVGIGNAPSVPFHVNTTQSADFIAIIEQSAATSGRLGLHVKSANTTAADQAMRVEVGGSAALQVFGNGAVSLPLQPRARAYNSATISHATSGSWQAVALDSERYDVGAMHSTAVNTSRLTATVAGTYRMSANLIFAANATGQRGVAIVVNGGTFIAATLVPAPPSGVIDLHVSCDYQLSATDYVEMHGFQSSGGALNMNASGNIAPEFSAAMFA